MRAILTVLLVGYGVFVWWFIGALHEAGNQISDYQRQLSEPAAVPAAIVRFNNVEKGLVVPSWKLFDANRPWAYVSAWSPIDTNFEPELVTLSVNKGPWMYDDKVRPEVDLALIDLFAAAKEEGQPLIVISAYRSAADQRDLYDSSAISYGNDWTRLHVAKPGQSEHQTGLAVDFSSYSPECVATFSGCNLRSDTAAWLAKNAYLHGFILRYPENKAHITKISHEPWHYRYVGKDLAQFIYESGLTLDEIATARDNHG